MTSSRRKARAKSTPAHLGASSIAGSRDDNQDRVAVGVVAGVEIIVVADGLGGLPRGGEAAGTVVNFVLGRLRRELPQALAGGEEGVRTFLLATAWATAQHLAVEARTQGLTNVAEGLRTTLIIAVALKDIYLVIWIGDGAATIVRQDGELVEMLEPHKDRAKPHVLHASLGPLTEGRPTWCAAPRDPGDLLVVATDGIGDQFDRALADLVRTRLDACAGDAARATELLADELAQVQEPDGRPKYDDNLTLAILSTMEA